MFHAADNLYEVTALAACHTSRLGVDIFTLILSNLTTGAKRVQFDLRG